MNININFSNFKKKHKAKKNQVLFHIEKCSNNGIVENIINNFLEKKNSFIFESVEKRKIRGRYKLSALILTKFGNSIKIKFILSKIIKKKQLKLLPILI